MLDTSSTLDDTSSTLISAYNFSTSVALKLNRFNLACTKQTSNTTQTQAIDQSASSNTSQPVQNQAPRVYSELSGRIMARKPDVYAGETSIDNWIDSIKA